MLGFDAAFCKLNGIVRKDAQIYGRVRSFDVRATVKSPQCLDSLQLQGGVHLTHVLRAVFLLKFAHGSKMRMCGINRGTAAYGAGTAAYGTGEAAGGAGAAAAAGSGSARATSSRRK